MLGLIYKDAICLKKNLKMFVAVGFGVMLLAVMFALSCKMGNISDGLSNYDSTDTMGKELLVAVIDLTMHMVLIIPIAFIANIVDCFTEDYKSGFYNKLLGMPLKYTEIVGARYLSMLLYGVLGFLFALITGVGISMATDRIVFKELMSVVFLFAGIFVAFMGIVIPSIYLFGARKSNLICSAPFIGATIVVFAYVIVNDDKIPESDIEMAILFNKFLNFITHKGGIFIAVGLAFLVLSYFVSVLIIKHKRGGGI